MVNQSLGNGWLKFTNNILLPLGAIMSVIRILVLIGNADSLPEGYVGGQVLSAVVSLGLSGALFFGLKQFKSWAWYLMLVTLVLTPIGAALSRIPGNTGNQGVTVALLVIGLLMWTLPNFIYFYRRKSWFGVLSADSTTSQNDIILVSDQEEAVYEKALKEFEAGQVREGLWAKVVAESTGPDKQKQLYLQYRARQMLHNSEVVVHLENRQAIKFWAGFVAKRVGCGVALFFGSGWLCMGLIYLFAGNIYSSSMLVGLVGMSVLIGFPIYLYFSIQKEKRRRSSNAMQS
jgi:hypothetical protein